MNENQRARLPLLIGILLCTAIYLPNLDIPLIWDDYGTLVTNQALDKPIPVKEFFTQEYFDFSREQSWRPLATWSYNSMLRAFGRSPLGMRAVQLLFHILNGLLLAAFLMACGLSAAACAWAAAFFLIHPAHTETLMCVAFNEEVLTALGLLIMFLAHQRRKPWLAAGGFAFALLAKETAMMALPLIAIYDQLKHEETWLERGKAYALPVILAGLYLWIHSVHLQSPGGQGHAFSLPFWHRLYFAASSVVTAVRVFFIPISLRIEYFALPASSIEELLLWIGAAASILAAWAWLINRYRKRQKLLVFLLLWPAPFLLLTSNLFPLEALNMRLMAERWMYLPCLGAAAALAWALRRMPRCSMIVLLLWSGCALWRIRDWTQETRLWESLLSIYPWCAKAEEGLAESYDHRKMLPETLAAYQRALDLRNTRQDKVLDYYLPLSSDKSMRWESPSLERGLGRTYLKLGRIHEAESHFLKAAGLDPADGYTYDIMAYRFAEAGDFAKAGEWVRRGLQAVPREEVLLRLEPDITRRKLSFKASFD